MTPIRLLIIDDQERLLRVIRLGLQPLGYAITSVNSAQEGLEILMEKPFDLLLTDIRMPEMTGLELVYELNRLDVDIPVMVMTAHADVDSAVKAFKQGAVDYIRKPFTIEELDAALKQAFKRRATLRQETPLPTLNEGIEAKEKELILKALARSGNNRLKAAKILKISERSLYYKLKKLGIL